jgi:diguanylate cyclase (GGDEF)-like protein/PAS domain S-box-containing protein
MLVRQSGDQILYLSELQHIKGTALALNLPISNSSLPASIALKDNAPGTTHGIDYMGQHVLAAYDPVAATDWRIITKIDRREVLMPLWNMILLISGIAFVFIVAISMALLLIWRQQSRMQSLLTLAHKSQSERLLQHFFDMPFVGMAVISPANKQLENFNDYLCEITGYSRQELMGKSCLAFTHPDDVEADIRELNRILQGDSDGYVMEKRLFRKDGSEIFVVVDTKCIREQDGAVRYLFSTAQDITRYKVAEARIQRLTRFYAVLSQCNQSIVRLTSEKALFEKICQTAVTYGAMRMAWIGMINPQTSMIEPVASHGDDIGYLENIQISCDAASPYGNGPNGIAIRQNQPYWCQDYAADMLLAPWAQKGSGIWGSSAAIPITRGSVVVGTLNIYASEKQAFDEDAKSLLMEMAVDIGFALDNFDKEISRSIAQAQLMESESKFHLLFDQSLDGLLIIDREEIIECNPAAIDLIGYPLEQILHVRPWAFGPDFQPDGVSSEDKMQQMLDTTRDQGRCRFEWMHQCADETQIPLEVTMVAIMLQGRQVFYSTWRNISEQKNAEARIRYLAQYDVLTNLPNRALLTDRVNQAINIAQRNDQNLVVMFFDLDRFKNINDSMGHGIGDELLIEVSRRLHAVVREQDTVSRLGGDEFVILLLDTSEEGAVRVAKKLMAAVAAPCHIDHHEIIITSSIGIAVYPDDGKNFDDLLKSADIAMYRAKRSGRNNYHFFTMKMQEDTLRVMHLTAALHQAIELNQLSLNFQPQLSLDDGNIIGAEVLLRWQHPDFGLVSPAEFIPIAEDTGDIMRIGEWVLRQTIRQLKQWQSNGMPSIMLAVNLSAAQFRHPQLPDLIELLLAQEDLSACYLELELTESVSMDDPAAAVEMMDKLASLGVRMSIDDFGTGYSSLSYLKRFKAYKLKIDQSFVRDIMVDVDDRAIVQTIITLAKSLGMKTIAEGVETQEQMDFLRRSECDELQGYHFSHPLSATEFEAFYKKHRPQIFLKR